MNIFKGEIIFKYRFKSASALSYKIITTVILVILSSCTFFRKAEFESKLIKYDDSNISFIDNSDSLSMIKAIDNQLKWLTKKEEKYKWQYGKRTVFRNEMTYSLKIFKQLWSLNFHNKEKLSEEISTKFDIYTLRKGHGKTRITSYYSPIYQGSLEKDETYRWPIYKIPNDAYTIETNNFDKNFILPGKARSANRVVARIDSVTKRVLPYYTREEIDFENSLAGKECEIVYLKNYFDLFSLHVQGGGFININDSIYLKVNYAGKNSHSYKSIGRILLKEEKIAKENISMASIREYLERDADEMKRICSQNPSYVFYSLDSTHYTEIDFSMAPHGSLDFPVTPGRSFAADKKFFPGGELAFISAEDLDKQNNSKLKISNFCIDQDTGGAILNNHLDFYAGIGKKAGDFAGNFHTEKGEIYFLIIKKGSYIPNLDKTDL